MEDELSLIERRKYQKFRITVEPVALLLCFAFAIQGIVIQNLYLTKVCLNNFQLNATVCASHNHSTEAESQYATSVQKYVSTLNIYASLIENIPSVLLVLFLGPWSEKNGRKLPMMLPVIGHIFSVAFYIANYYFFSWPAELILLASIPIGLSGGTPTLLMALNSYIADITSTETRTSRISILYGCLTLSFPIASFISIFIYTYGGYFGIWGTSLSVAVVTLLYIIFFVTDSRGPEELNKRINSSTHINDDDPPPSSCSIIQVLKNLNECFAVTFQERNGYKRVCLTLLLASVCIYIFQVPSSVSYLYTKKLFDWDQPQYALFTTISSISVVIGNIFVLPILSSYFKVRDSIIGMIAITGNMAGLLSFAFATTAEILYFASVCYLLTSCIIVVIRSMLSKLVLSDELSHVFSVLASLESIVPLICTPAFNLIYEATIDVFPGCVFLVAAGLNFIVLILLSLVLVLLSKERQDPVLIHVEDDGASASGGSC